MSNAMYGGYSVNKSNSSAGGGAGASVAAAIHMPMPNDAGLPSSSRRPHHHQQAQQQQQHQDTVWGGGEASSSYNNEVPNGYRAPKNSSQDGYPSTYPYSQSPLGQPFQQQHQQYQPRQQVMQQQHPAASRYAQTPQQQHRRPSDHRDNNGGYMPYASPSSPLVEGTVNMAGVGGWRQPAITPTPQYQPGPSVWDTPSQSSHSSHQQYTSNPSAPAILTTPQQSGGPGRDQNLYNQNSSRSNGNGNGSNMSPSLPALNTSTTSSGFSNLYQQLEAEMDMIHQKHSPMASPITPSTTSNARTPIPSGSNKSSGTSSSSSSSISRPQVPGNQYHADGGSSSRHASSSSNSVLQNSSGIGGGSLQPVARRQDSDNTVRGEGGSTNSSPSYGGEGIISLYDGRAPSPGPSHNSSQAAFRQTTPQYATRQEDSQASSYQLTTGQAMSLSTEPINISSKSATDSSTQAQYQYPASFHATAPQAGSYRQPVSSSSGYNKGSGNGNASSRRKGGSSVHSQQSVGSTSTRSDHSSTSTGPHAMYPVRPLPSSPTSSSAPTFSSVPSNRSSSDTKSYKSSRPPRPSVESNFSSSSISASSPADFATVPTSPIHSTSHTGLSRPSMSSSIGSSSRPSFSSNTEAITSTSYGRTNVRPLPVPQESAMEEREQFAGSRYKHTYSPDVIEDSPMSDQTQFHGKSTLDRTQSDFTKEFYASGSSLPDDIRWPNGVPQRVQSQREAPASRGTVRRPALDDSSQHQQPRQGSNRPAAAPSASSLSTLSASSMATLSTSPSSLSPGVSQPYLQQHQSQQHAQPHLHHSHSDPIANLKSPPATGASSNTTSSATPPPRLRNASFNGPSVSSGLSYSHSSSSSSTRTPQNHPASRSASFSNSSSVSMRPEGGSRRNASLGGSSARNAINRMSSVPEPSPPLPSSPSISISTSFYDTSIASAQSYASMPASTSSSAYASALRKQASLSPSNFSLSAQGFLSVRPKDNADRERRRMEGLGLQHLNPALLSNLAVALKDRVPRSENVKGSITYPASFTGEQVVSCLAEILPYPYTDDRRFATVIARNLHRNMFYHEVEWDERRLLRDSPEQVFCFEEEEQQATLDYLDDNMDGLPTSNAIHNRAKEASNRLLEEIPNGVITRFTKCYSPFCGLDGTSGSGSCYSLYCPNGAHPLGLQRKQSSVSLTPSTEEPPAEAWASNVSQALRDQIGPREVARQGVIFELVKGEQEYKKDLDMLEAAFAESLRSANPPVVDPHRLPIFLNQVFANLDEVRRHSGELINNFQIRQREQTPVVESIGDLVLDAALQWGQAYIDYAEAQVMGEYLVNEEKAVNSAFAAFLQSRREAFGIKHDFRHYHLRATIRLQRYLLLLAEYLKRTPDEHPDREPAQEAVRIIRQQCDACNAAVASAQLKMACVQYDKLIYRDTFYVNDLDLSNPSRQLFHHGKMFSKPDVVRSEWTEYQVMLFDHYLVIAKPRRDGPGYRLIRKPIRLEMLTVTGWDESPIIRSSGFHLSNVMRTGDRRDGGPAGAGDKAETKAWPVLFRISGREHGTYYLYVESPKSDRDGLARQEWKAKIDQAVAVRTAVLDANKVFKLNLLMDPDLRKTPNAGTNLPTMGKTLSSCPFDGPAGQKLIAVGTSSGLFITLRNDPGSNRQILQIPVQHCAVLQEFGIFLVRTEGRLLSYLLETLVQSSSSETKGQQGPQQLSGQKDILFFKVGRVGLRTLVVYAKKDGVSNTVLKAMEPVANNERSRVQHSRFLGMGGKKSEWFRLFKDASVPTEVYNLTFTRSKLALVCAPGFEILDIDTLKTGSFPDWASIKSDVTRYDSEMALLNRKCAESRALGLFRISDQEFLFCYDEFAFFADRHGDPVRARFGEHIDWEGRPDTVVYCKPYILAFDARFVEIRDTSQRGKLIQIIRGHGIRCTYDGQGLPSIEMDVKQGGVREPLERLPHIAMMVNNVEKLYELAPIVD